MAARDNIIVTPSSGHSPAGNGSAAGLTDERSAEEIRNNIAATRDSITETVDQLSSRVQRTLDWKTYVADYPLAATGVAAGLGILLGYFIQPRATPGQRIHTALADLVEEGAQRVQAQLGEAGLPRPALGPTLRATALAMFVKTAGDFVREKFAEKDRFENQAAEESYYADDTSAASFAAPRHPHDF
ncbi:MAG: DUF3618 domain-containing protein [Acidobacteria bacterium]|nr:DUF3618 domain-containing protein [Acidobacteriota bacterium]